MIRINNFGLVPCIVLSIIIHCLVFFVLFYKNNKDNIYIQVPFEVSFYSPIQTKIPEKVEPKEEVKPVVEEVKPVVKKINDAGMKAGFDMVQKLNELEKAEKENEAEKTSEE